MTGLDPNAPSSGISRPDHATLKLRAGNSDTATFTATAAQFHGSSFIVGDALIDPPTGSIELNGTLSGTGIVELLGGLGGGDDAAGVLAIASPYATGSFTVATATFRIMRHRLQLVGAERATLSGTGRLEIGGALATVTNTTVTAIRDTADGLVLRSAYSPGSFTVPSETSRILSRHLKLRTTERATLAGTATLRIT